MKRGRCRAVVGALAAGLAMGGHAAQAASNPTLPDWVMQAAATTGDWGHARAVFLLDDTVITLAANGRATEHYRGVVKILRPQGRDDAHPSVWFNGDEKIQSFHVWSIGPDGRHYAMKDAEYIEAGVEAWGLLYVDDKVKTAAAPGADPGGIVAWEYEKQLPSYDAEETWDFQKGVPVAHSSYEIDLPAGWHQEAVWFRHAAVMPAEVVPGHFRWEQANVEGIDLSDVPLAPAWRSLAGRMTVHFGADALPEGAALWTRLGNWYTNLAAPRSEGAADLAAEAKTLAGDGDFMVKLSRIADFMQQQIRYVGIEIGIGGLQPHAAEDIFRSRYGDCKDKATLMITMLDAVGIRATWMPVDDQRGVVDAAAPSLVGNHMIMAIEIPQGYDNPRLQAVVTAKTGRRYLIFDPTNEYVPIGELPEYEQGSWGLLAAGADSQVLRLPTLKPEQDTQERTAEFELEPDGTLKGDVTVMDEGASSWELRGQLARSSDRDRRQMTERALQQDLSTFTLGEEKAEHVRELDKPVELEYSVTAPLYARAAGNLLLVRPRVLGTDTEGLDNKPRTVPISFDGVKTWRDEFDVKIPTGYTVDDVPDPVNLDVGFAKYHSEVKADGNTLHYKREYVLNKLELAPDQYAALRQLQGQIVSDESSNAVLKKQ